MESRNQAFGLSIPLPRIVHLPKAEQERLQLADRVVYADMAGIGPRGYVAPFSLNYRLGNESAHTIASRFINAALKTDPDLHRNPNLGANALRTLGLHIGKILVALNWQWTEALALLDEPKRYLPMIEEALHGASSDLEESIAVFQRYAQARSYDQAMQSSSLRAKLAFLSDTLPKAIYGATTPMIDWQDVADQRKLVLLDFRNVPEEHRQFSLVWAHSTLLEWIRHRGPGRHYPLALYVDEVSALLGDASARVDPLAEDIEELITRLARNNQIWTCFLHQEMNQLNRTAARLFMDAGIQIIGRTADLESAMTVTKRFYRWSGREIKKVERVWHPPTMFADEWTEYRTTEFTRDEKAYRDALKLMDLPRYHFLVGVAPREGELPTILREVDISRYHEGKYVQPELVDECKRRLMQRHRRVDDVLAEIKARTQQAPRAEAVEVEFAEEMPAPPKPKRRRIFD